MEDRKKVWVLKLDRVQEQVFRMTVTNTAEFIFSSKEMLEKWLLEHNFVLGYHSDFKNPENPYWYHSRDKVWDHINVVIEEKQIDNNEVPEWLAVRSDETTKFIREVYDYEYVYKK